MIVETQCDSCGGTGIYHGFAEGQGIGVICLKCKGTGCRLLSYEPFVWRKTRQDIHTVMLSKGSFILSCGPIGNSITYEEFLAGKLPTNP